MIDILIEKLCSQIINGVFCKWLKARIFKKRIKLPSSIIFTFISNGVTLCLTIFLSLFSLSLSISLSHSLAYDMCISLTFSRSVSSNSLSFRIIFHSREWHLCLVKACCACMFVDYFSTSFFIHRAFTLMNI